MRIRAAPLAVLVTASCAIAACSSLVGKWQPSAELPPEIVLVGSQRPWTNTGMDVTAGQLLFFTAKGEVRWASGGSLGVGLGPDGLDGGRGWPVGRGGLIGRVGEAGKAFDIGARTRPFRNINRRGYHRPYPPPPIRMPVSGRLFLGFKQYPSGDNQGWFEVTVRAAEPIASKRQ